MKNKSNSCPVWLVNSGVRLGRIFAIKFPWDGLFYLASLVSCTTRLQVIQIKSELLKIIPESRDLSFIETPSARETNYAPLFDHVDKQEL